jgi:predicted ATPase
MLTRLKVKGFKSLEDIEVLFGPLTCIAGTNGVGKSNLFDAIQFLKDLTDTSIIDAATRVRNRDERGNNLSLQRQNISSLFTKTATHQIPQMEFEAEFLVNEKVIDDFAREATPKVTYLIYKLVLKYVHAESSNPEGIELVEESLSYILKGEARNRLGFPMTKEFFNSVYHGGSRIDFIYTEKENGHLVVKIRQDQTSGQPITIPILKTGRTALSSINTIDRPTVLAARREMQSWALLQLESSSLRQPDNFISASTVSDTGKHLPATLARLGRNANIANELANLLPDVKTVSVDIDDKRQLKTLYLETTSGIKHEARALSDGTLRFLALAIIGADAKSGGVICLEEPENGIHPARIPAMIELLYRMVVDPDFAVESDKSDNPLRQVIINTHSPLVVQKIETKDLVVAQAYRRDGTSLSQFSSIEGTWRHSDRKVAPIGFGTLLDYLGFDDKDEEGDIDGKVSVKHYLKHQLELTENAK